ncbi:hypothetical protein [Priestia endophytica]|jgi:hypothetical protein|uniref:hypothetical protein n=1 Tax=Priestia endophytica TaxID=135735 RepID=UPI000DCA5EFB|nr:hypothetical protein [Priestia endophytica]MED4070560.1 hypothetical protein [Priestia endophytica]RAS88730.1 hypothetical protein A4U60_02675 [Priestia endophytica]
MKRLLKFFIMTLLISIVYQSRYQLLNMLLRNRVGRSLAVRTAFNFPYIRGKMMSQLFKY